MKLSQNLTWFGILGLSLCASALVFYATAWGPWAGSDSAAYLAAAKNVAAGAGFKVVRPSGEAATLIAPVYPLALARLSKLGIPILTGARWLNIVLFGVFIFLMGFSFSRLSHTPWLGIPVSLLMLVFPVLVDLFSGMMTEPLFLVLTFGALFGLCFYLMRKRWWFLGLAAVLGGLAAITRFIGIALLPLGALVLLVFLPTSWKGKMRDAILYAVLFVAATLPWDIWYFFNRDTSAPLEKLAWSSAWDYLQPVRANLVSVLWEWIPFSGSLPVDRYLWKVLILGLILLSFTAFAAWGARRLFANQWGLIQRDRDLRLVGVMVFFIVIYLAVFIFIYLFRRPSQDIDERTLLPLYPALVVTFFGVLSLLHRSLAGNLRRVIGGLAWAACIAGVIAYLPLTLQTAVEYHKVGSGYTGAAWQTSQTIQAVRDLPSGMKLISNDTGALLFLTDRYGLEISELYRTTPLEGYPRYGDDPLDETQRYFREEGAALVLFQPAFYWRMHEIYQENTEARLSAFTSGLTLYGQYPDGAIYFYPQK